MVEHPASFVFERELAAVPRARGFVDRWLRSQSVPSSECFRIGVAANEAISNACRHSDAPPSIPVRVTCNRERDRVVIEVTDGGNGFDAHGEHDRDPSTESIGGRGLFLMQELMDEVRVTTTTRTTTVSLTLRLPAPI